MSVGLNFFFFFPCRLWVWSLFLTSVKFIGHLHSLACGTLPFSRFQKHIESSHHSHCSNFFHSYISPLLPSSTLRDSYDYSGPTEIVQENLTILKSAGWEFHLNPFAVQCNIFTGSRVQYPGIFGRSLFCPPQLVSIHVLCTVMALLKYSSLKFLLLHEFSVNQSFPHFQ